MRVHRMLHVSQRDRTAGTQQGHHDQYCYDSHHSTHTHVYLVGRSSQLAVVVPQTALG